MLTRIECIMRLPIRVGVSNRQRHRTVPSSVAFARCVERLKASDKEKRGTPTLQSHA